MVWMGSEDLTGQPNGTDHGGDDSTDETDPPIAGTNLNEVYLHKGKNHDYTL